MSWMTKAFRKKPTGPVRLVDDATQDPSRPTILHLCQDCASYPEQSPFVWPLGGAKAKPPVFVTVECHARKHDERGVCGFVTHYSWHGVCPGCCTDIVILGPVIVRRFGKMELATMMANETNDTARDIEGRLIGAVRQ